jgi:hypothetical protein
MIIFSRLFENTKFENRTLDFDSTVLKTNGMQQVAEKGYFPHGMAFMADVKLVANLWPRGGVGSSNENFVGFPEGTLHKPGKQTVSLLRPDGGFHGKEVFNCLEKRVMPAHYITAVWFYQTWLTVDEGIEISGLQWQSPQWEKNAGKTLKLFNDEEYHGGTATRQTSPPILLTLLRKCGDFTGAGQFRKTASKNSNTIWDSTVSAYPLFSGTEAVFALCHTRLRPDEFIPSVHTQRLRAANAQNSIPYYFFHRCIFITKGTIRYEMMSDHETKSTVYRFMATNKPGQSSFCFF